VHTQQSSLCRLLHTPMGFNSCYPWCTGEHIWEKLAAAVRGGDCVGRLNSLAIFLPCCIRTAFNRYTHTAEVILDIPPTLLWSGDDFSSNVQRVRLLCHSHASQCSFTHKPSLHGNICLVFNLVPHSPYVLQVWPSLGRECQESFRPNT